MGKLTVGALALAAAALVAAPASARTVFPWCLIVQDQDGIWAGAVETFAQCEVEARAGNTGFCAANPAYQAPAAAPGRPAKRRHPR